MTNSEILHLRPVEDTDREQLWIWSNDPEVRARSFNSRPIPWEAHCHWFSTRLADHFWKAWIGIDSSYSPVGVVRFQVRETRAEIGVSVAIEARGRGFGRALITQGCTALFQTLPIVAVDALIKPDNIPSLVAFRASGFREVDISSPILHPHRYLVLERLQQLLN
ncbi:hypothetical protein CCP3SC1_2140002 [Gammaproteobacteria bacterium]